VIDGAGTDGGDELPFDIDGDVVTASYRDASVDPSDEIEGRSVTGSVDDELDAYWFDGDITDFRLAATRTSTSSTTPEATDRSQPVLTEPLLERTAFGSCVLRAIAFATAVATVRRVHTVCCTDYSEQTRTVPVLRKYSSH